jgi:hypothetical protein
MADVDVSSIRPEELEDLVKGLEHYLSKIKKGEGPQERAAAFGHGGNKGCKDLDYNCPMSHFTDAQHELVANTLVNMFGVENDTEANYIMKVCFPEALIKLYMNFHKKPYDQAEEELFNLDVHKVSYICSFINR